MTGILIAPLRPAVLLAKMAATVDEVTCSPAPPAGEVPVWFAGGTDRATMRRVATLGAGWLPLRPPGEAEMAQVLADLGVRGQAPDLGVGQPPSDSDVLGPTVPADGLTVTVSVGYRTDWYGRRLLA